MCMYVYVCVCVCDSKRDSKRGGARLYGCTHREKRQRTCHLSISLRARLKLQKRKKKKNSQNFLPFIRLIEDTCEVVNLSSSSTRYELQCVAVCFSVVQYVAAWCSMLQFVAV